MFNLIKIVSINLLLIMLPLHQALAWESAEQAQYYETLSDSYQQAARDATTREEWDYYRKCQKTIDKLIDLENRKDYDANHGNLYQQDLWDAILEVRSELESLGVIPYQEGRTPKVFAATPNYFEFVQILQAYDYMDDHMGSNTAGRIREGVELGANLTLSGLTLGLWYFFGPWEVNPAAPDGFCGSQTKFLNEYLNDYFELDLQYYEFVAVGIGGYSNHVALGIAAKGNPNEVIWVLDGYYGLSLSLSDWVKAMHQKGYAGGPRRSQCLPYEE